MNPSSHSHRAVLLACVGLLALLLAPGDRVQAAAALSAQGDFTATYQRLIEERAAAIVPIRYVITMTAAGQEQRHEDRTQGVLVSSDGLVLVSGRAVSIDLAALNPLAAAAGGAGMVASASDFRVRLPGSDEWRPAALVTRDTELGLAWLRIAGVSGLSHLDFAAVAEPAPGRIFYTVLRTSDEWGAVPVVRPGAILGATRVPRNALLVDGMPGLAFDAAGLPMGFVDVDLAALTRGQGRGLGLDLADLVMHMLPAERVAEASRRAATLPLPSPP